MPKLIGRYEILSVLGQGAFGEVYKARDPNLDRIVVLKPGPRAQDLGPSEMDRLLREARALSQVQHPGVVSLLDVIVENDQPYLVYEYVEGTTLAERIGASGQSAGQAAHVVESLARAVHAVHRQGLTHGQLTPNNVLITANGTPRITDLSPPPRLRERADNLTASGAILGTPAYMAPEQMTDGTTGPGTDVYALGAILYQSLTGRPPFEGNPAAVAYRATSQAPQPPHEINPSVPRDLEAICLRCLEKDPARRYPTAEALADDLHRALAPPPAMAPAAAPPPRTRGGGLFGSPPAAANPVAPPARSEARREAAPAPPPPGEKPKGRGGLFSAPPAAAPASRSITPPQGSAGDPRRNGTPEMPGGTIDPVVFTVTAPSVLRPAIPCLIEVWAHLERQRNEVLERARDAAGEAIRSKSKGPVAIARGTVVNVHLKVEDLVIDEPDDTVFWQGEIGNATFAVQVPADLKPGPRSGVAVIHIRGLQVARVHFVVQVGTTAGTVGPLATEEHRHRKAFVSYAGADRDRVLPRIQGIQKAAPALEVFFDVMSLRSGQNWERELWQVIPASDIFYLFWSENAKKSEWVEKEWRCALQTKGLDFIDPVPLDPPSRVPPPTELAGKHFNDWVLAFLRTQHEQGASWAGLGRQILGWLGMGSKG